MTTTSLTRRAAARGDERAPAPDVPRRSLPVRIVRGRVDDPDWARPGLLGLLTVTGVLYLWNLGANGNSNSFYAAAVQAASVSWKAWFFGSFDSASFITVDKPPASMWVMGLSARIFGYNTWSMLVPQVLLGLGAVALLYAAVKRWHGPAAGLLAGAALALTPAAALMFRFNNPDALLTFLMVAAAYCVVRSLEKAQTSWILAAGSLIGFAFLTKMMQAFLVLPAFALVYLICAPTSFWRRLWQSLAALAAVIVSAGWWIAIVELLPASARPYVGGSENNSILELVVGYNGLGRILGGDGNGGGNGGGGGMGGNSSFGGATGITRLFRDEMGFEISWLLPAALIALVAGLAINNRKIRASMILWGGWLVVTGLTFSFMQGTVHPYYTVALAPAIAALVAIVGVELWRRNHDWFARAALATMVFASGLWSYTLLARNDTWMPWLRVVILLLTIVATLGLLVPGRIAKRALIVLVITGALGGALGTAAYGVTTAQSAHSGSIPSVGPSSSGGGGFGGGGDNATSSSELTQLLKNAGTTWAAATVGSQSAATLQLASEKPVMAIGGFTGSDPAPTLAEFKQMVAAGEVRYFVSGGGGMGGGRGNSDISSWVSSNYTATTVGGYTVYDLLGSAS